jgi:hypothetical protein
VIDIEGEESQDQDTLPDNDNIDNEFKALMDGTDPLLESSAFITEVNSIDPSNARDIAISLANNAISHILLRE